MGERKSRVETVRQAARALETGEGPGRFEERPGKLAKHKPVEEPA